MAEALSPNPNPKQRPQILSPGSPFFLASNDDQLERAQARAIARAAAIRRKATTVVAPSAPPDSSPCLNKENILELFQNCIKLASENKINQKNTWELTLIDHLCDIIKVDVENDVETNFQKASCTLEAGVKIYSMRVDSVHSEAYKVLGAIKRVGQGNEDGTVEDSDISAGQEENKLKKEKDRKLSPISTLESSYELLNVKKFDAAFAIDPLYHQTSAQFDEGGAKGLLLNNLGVYGGCRVLFDSLEVPAKCSSCFNSHDKETIDISFAQECSEEMVLNMSKKFEISPSLRDIVNLFNDDDKRASDTFSPGKKYAEQVDEPYNSSTDFGANTFESGGTWNLDHDDQNNVDNEGTYGGDPNLTSHYEDKETTDAYGHDTDDRIAEIDAYLFLNLGIPSKLNAWAGPDHWKFRKVRGSDNVMRETGSPVIIKKPKNKKQKITDIEFLKPSDKEMSDVFAPPKNPKALLLPTNREPCNTTLPEDCRYQPESLVKLFLLPNVLCLGRNRRKFSAEVSHQTDRYNEMPSWDDETGFADYFGDENNGGDVDDSNALVSQPRQVNKIEVRYDRRSKQVDVQALKETLWESLQQSQAQGKTISFKHTLATFPDDCRAVASLEDISPHLCFISLLHLANEHGLSIQGNESLDDLSIHLPQER
ncbi:hypothetical protein ACET3Z_022976 [Daucus carota]